MADVMGLRRVSVECAQCGALVSIGASNTAGLRDLIAAGTVIVWCQNCTPEREEEPEAEPEFIRVAACDVNVGEVFMWSDRLVTVEQRTPNKHGTKRWSVTFTGTDNTGVRQSLHYYSNEWVTVVNRKVVV